jgi:hypothetical protein
MILIYFKLVNFIFDKGVVPVIWSSNTKVAQKIQRTMEQSL